MINNRPESIAQILNRVMNNKKIIDEILDCVIKECAENPNIEKFLLDKAIMGKFSIILQYYIATRDANTNYTFDEITKKYLEIQSNKLSDIIRENISTKGVLTHSFCGAEKELVEKYGFEYKNNLNETTLAKINEIYYCLHFLESFIGANQYLSNQTDHIDLLENQSPLYVCLPGFETVQYAMKFSPERLYNGPLKNLSGYIIVGESKKDFISRTLKNRLTQLDLIDIDGIDFYIENVVEYFCTSNPCIALIDISQVHKIPICVVSYNESTAIELEEYINDKNCEYIDDFFSTSIFNPNIHGKITSQIKFKDMVTLTKHIPPGAISVVSIPDLFQIKQLLARRKGYKDGEIIDYETCIPKEKKIPFQSLAQNAFVSGITLTDINFANNIDQIENTSEENNKGDIKK